MWVYYLDLFKVLDHLIFKDKSAALEENLQLIPFFVISFKLYG